MKDKLRIAVECYHLLARDKGAGGAGEYIHGLLELLQHRADLTIICSENNYDSLQYYSSANCIKLAELTSESVNRILETADIFYDPLNGMHVPDVRTDRPVVCSIYDLQHSVHPEFLGPEMVAARDVAYGFAIERCDKVVTLTDAEVRNFRHYWGASNVDYVYLAPYTWYHYTPAADQRVLQADFNNGSGYLIYPAIPWPHKNHTSLIQAYSLLFESLGPENCPHLVMTGADHSLSESLPALQSLQDREVRKYIHALGFVSSEHLASLMKNARAMVFPSLYEGFGIPVVEALQFRTPVICSPLPALEEICGQSVAYFRDPKDPQKIYEDIAAILSNPLQVVESPFSRERVLDDALALFTHVVADFSVNKQPESLAFRRALAEDVATLHHPSPASEYVPARVLKKEISGDVIEAIFTGDVIDLSRLVEFARLSSSPGKRTPFHVIANPSSSTIDWRKVQIAIAHLQLRSHQHSVAPTEAAFIFGAQHEIDTTSLGSASALNHSEPPSVIVYRNASSFDERNQFLVI
ncbi:glycosyltransferase family 1 protein [Rhizobium sp. P28RR-XV]|uniref:glycosyltransferase family 4 protein n=1 Tax=Rhizobium sp. P28RR-XV TaxID=2726737 RepID=UPI00145783F9|nr:glycosyltransferase family 1 protein [Rhizobium sp. P28RR-XV]NLR89229.1 glycosyltransferase family 4 protein [Rhizobium sp. P28RR-XV]